MVLDEIDACDAEMEALTIQLERARQKKAALARERELREEAQAAAAARQNTSNGPLHMQSADDLQRQIDELKRQLAAQEAELQTAVTIGTSYATEDNEDANRGNDTSCKMPQRRSTIKECHTDPNQPPVRPTRHASIMETSPEEVQAVASCIEENLSPVQSPKSAVGSSSPYAAATSPPPCKGASELAKEKHNWEKPAWALPSTVVHTDESILTDSIQHGLKKPSSGGYERKVHAKETLELIKGTFVAPQTKIPDPRMVWIVLNVDGSKVGKIVMHLYGNVLPLVDIFLELKGLELKNNSAGQWYVDDIDPAFYVHHGPASTFKGPTSVCFGTVLEGQDVLQTINQAAPSGAVVTIKQSHIFPVKKAKS
jgi:hypothetical protein